VPKSTRPWRAWRWGEKASTRKIAMQGRTTHGGTPGHSTVHRRLREQGTRWASVARKPALTDTQKAKRLAFAQGNLGRDWSAVFADEVKLKLFTRAKIAGPASMTGHHARQFSVRRPSTWWPASIMVASGISGASHRTSPEP